MFKNMKFKKKVLIIPFLATFVLLLILIVSILLSGINKNLLEKIENGYYPSVELSRDLEETLNAIQQGMQEAVAISDEETLAEIDTLYDRFISKIETQMTNPLVRSDELKQLRNEFHDYYTYARNVVGKIIQGETDEEGVASIGIMLEKYNAIKDKLELNTKQDKRDIGAAFLSTRNNFNTSIVTTIIVSFVFMIAVIVLTIFLSKSITKPVANLLKTTNDFTIGKTDAKVLIDSSDEIGELGQAINNMIDSIVTSNKEIEQQNWLKTGQTDLNDKMRGELDHITLAQNAINYIAEYSKAQIGAIYLNSENNTFKLVGSYAYSKRKNLSNECKLGEGIIGQAALEKKLILITDIPDDYIKINSGLGEAVPKNILAVPFMYEDQVKGVIELGSFHDFDDNTIEFLKQATENIGINFNSAESRTKLQELLEKTQQQAEELQSQQEELRQTNEELEEQAQHLKESESRLQAQQEELRQTNEELEEKTQSLEEQKEDIRKKNTDLEEAQKMLEQRAQELEITSKYKSEFLANMSHELRTPLNSLLILSKILFQNKDNNLTNKQVEFAQTIHAAGTELLNIINEILDLAKVESGKAEVNIEKITIVDLAADIEKNYKHLVEDKGLKFKIQTAKALPKSLFTDEQRLKQIIKNFISNAIKFTEKGSINISIKRPGKEIALSNSGLVRENALAISVSDSGKGIPKDKHKVIFEAFQQEDGTTSRKFGGTGLGLSIAKEMARLLGGEIQLKSEVGKGSTFTLFISDLKDRHVELEIEEPEMEEIKRTPQPARKMEALKSTKSVVAVDLPDDKNNIADEDRTILIVEDDVKFAKILIDLAHERKFKCLVAQQGRMGLQFAEQYKPDAIILDIGLPDIDGWTVMEKLKDNPDTRHIPVHFMSASDRTMEALRMGAIGFVTKPVSMEGLEVAFTKIENIISKSIKNLLVVEDDEIQRKSIIELIGNSDVRTTAIESGKQAFELLKTNSFDCLVLDLGLEDLSGFELLQMIEAEPSISHIPIIIYTGKEISRQEEAKLKKHAESIIIKGVRSPDRLFDEVTLFLHRVEANLPEDKQRILQMIHDKEMLFQNKNILLVDDDMRNVFALSNVLEEKGMNVIIGKNGKEGLDLLENNGSVDLVLMDIMMPEMDGYEAMRKIREKKKFEKLPMIALTAKAMKGDRTKCIDAGANDYLSKPVDPDKLLSLLRVWLYR